VHKNTGIIVFKTELTKFSSNSTKNFFFQGPYLGLNKRDLRPVCCLSSESTRFFYNYSNVIATRNIILRSTFPEIKKYYLIPDLFLITDKVISTFFLFSLLITCI